MRPFEILVSAANLMTFFILTFPQIRTTPWAKYGVLIALLLTIIQVVFEGPRWPMVPAYALTGLFLSVWLLQTRTSVLAGPLFANKLAIGLTIGFSLLGLLQRSGNFIRTVCNPTEIIRMKATFTSAVKQEEGVNATGLKVSVPSLCEKTGL